MKTPEAASTLLGEIYFEVMFTRSVQNLKNTDEVKKGQRGKTGLLQEGKK